MRQHGAQFYAAVSLVFATALCSGLLMAQTPAAPAPSADLNQLMRGLFFPNSNVVFSTQRVNPADVKRAPEPSAATDPIMGVFGGWDAIETAALTLIDGSDLLMTPGRVCSNGKAVPIANPDWVKFVSDLRAAGKVAYESAKTKNIDKMFDASDVLNTACANCHGKYRRATRCQ
ncbi:MAG: hypothetical protein ABI995_06710 [Acidobacteriota bacterium]